MRTAPAGPMVVTKGCTNSARIAVGPTFMSLQPPKKKYIKPSIKPLYKPYCDGNPEKNTHYNYWNKISAYVNK